MGRTAGISASLNSSPAIPLPTPQRKRSVANFSFRRIFSRPSRKSKESKRKSNRDDDGGVGGGGSATEKHTKQKSFHPHLAEPEDSASIGSCKNEESHFVECPLCLTERKKEDFPIITTCEHRSCQPCLSQYLNIEITESRVSIACPQCSECFHPSDIKSILQNDELMRKYEEFALRRYLVADPDARWCPSPDCGYAVIATGCASCPKLECDRPGCNTSFCYHCKSIWHPDQTCDTARGQRLPQYHDITSYHELSPLPNSDVKACPRCSAFIMKMDDGSCNHMSCAICGAEFCWLCVKEISDLHYLSPSGCTFWGKQQWSKKKKLFWQLGTLVGAPLGIALIAGITLPAVIIGTPIWVGRKIYTKFKNKPKHRRNLYIVAGVSASVIISPLFAALAVGIGVPVLLAYVYGVVPITLCRASGCDVSAADGKVKIEYDDQENHISVFQPDSASMLVQNVVNPSIGEDSLATTISVSGSQIDNLGKHGNRDSISNLALAGESISGSLCGSVSTAAGPSVYHSRCDKESTCASVITCDACIPFEDGSKISNQIQTGVLDHVTVSHVEDSDDRTSITIEDDMLIQDSLPLPGSTQSITKASYQSQSDHTIYHKPLSRSDRYVSELDRENQDGVETGIVKSGRKTDRSHSFLTDITSKKSPPLKSVGSKKHKHSVQTKMQKPSAQQKAMQTDRISVKPFKKCKI